MTHEVDLRQTFNRIRAETSAACGFFHTWKALESAKGNPKLREMMNDTRHVDFFRLSMAGNFSLYFLSLGKIFDKSKRAINFQQLKELLRGNGYDNLACEIDKVCTNHSRTIEKIWDIRNKAVAHIDPDAIDKVFEEARITPDEIEATIDAARDVINKISRKLEHPNGISSGRRNRQAVQNLLENLRKCRGL